MGFRTVVLTNRCRASYKSGYLLVRNETTTMIHLSEIAAVIADTTAVYVSAYLLNELANAKIPVIICDEKHNPSGVYLPLYGAHNTSKRIVEQIQWDSRIAGHLWTKVVQNKIDNQALVLEDAGLSEASMLREYSANVIEGDKSNREGHAAKVYFNALFGKEFSRDQENDINAMLNYGYAILLSFLNKELVSKGYLTQLGICHRNEYNQYNLSCDFMEPFRPVIDYYVMMHWGKEFSHDSRIELVGLMDEYFFYKDGNYHLSSILSLYVQMAVAIMNGDTDSNSYCGFDLIS